MLLERKDYLNGLCNLAVYKDVIYYVELPLSSDIQNLTTSLKHKLRVCIKILSDYKRDLKLFFSESDIVILQKLVNFQRKWPDFFEDIKENIVKYSTKSIRIISEIIVSNDLSKYDRKCCNILTKWYDFANNGESKIECIENNQLYGGFTSGFNDIFDSRLHCYEGLMVKLADKYIHEKFVNVRDKGLPRYIKKRIVHYYQIFFNSANADCFSKCSSIDFSSHNMWGHYCRSELGVALEYNVLDYLTYLKNSAIDLSFLINIARGRVKSINDSPLFTQSEYKASFAHTRLFEMNYIPDYHPFTFFDKYLSCISDHLKNITDKSLYNKESYNIQQDFYTHKSQQWQFEKEVRLLDFNYLYSNSRVLDHPLNMKCFLENYDKVLVQIDNYECAYMKTQKSRVPFIKPSKIILKWDCDEQDDKIYKLLMYAKKNNIPALKLNSEIDYRESQFRYKICRV